MLAAASIAVVLAPDAAVGAIATQALVVLVGTAPLVVAVLALSARRRAWSAVAGAAGLVTVATGVVLTVAGDALQLLRLDFPITQVLTNAATTLAPLGLIAAGLGMAVAGLAGWLSDRVLGAVAASLGILLGGVLAVSLLASAFAQLPYIGGTVQIAPILAAAVTGLATIALIVVATRWWTVGVVAETQAPGTRVGSRRSVARGAILALLLVLVAGAALWGRSRLGDRLELAELFPDPALAECVAAALQTPVTEAVSERDLTGISDLTCSTAVSTRDPIQGLAGLEHLPGLYRLDLSGQAVHDLGPLSQAPQLSSLTLTSNAVSDLGPLTRLTSLSNLGLSDNYVTDLTPLGELTALQDLGLAGNQITDVAPLAALPQLDRLTLADNQITDPSPLANSSLTMLDVARNQIADAGTIAVCATVTELWIGGNPLTDLRPLLQMPGLIGVDLSDSDSSRLAGVQELRDSGVYVGGLA